MKQSGKTALGSSTASPPRVIVRCAYEIPIHEQLLQFVQRNPGLMEQLPQLNERGFRHSAQFEIFFTKSMLNNFFSNNPEIVYAYSANNTPPWLTINPLDTLDGDYRIDFFYRSAALAEIKFEYVPLDVERSFLVICNTPDLRIERILRGFCHDLRSLTGNIKL